MIKHSWTPRLAAAVAVLMAVSAPAASQTAADPLPPGFDARTVELRSNWTGLSLNSPVDWVLRLERQGDTYTFVGTVEMALGRADARKKAGPLPVTIPDSVMRAFLGALASAPRRPGVYETILTHTDDYPQFTITLTSDAGVVEFFSDSHSTQNWRVTIGGQQHVSDSTAPYDAQAYLHPYSRQADLDRILTAAGARKE
ncbi:MAG TPA: hypothetical protein VJT67_16370 [Longimicrobiaceae bacterium]|nr:hypothetical protein [Longimicrobiaceae bacterium]